ncbi:hypothetical protein D3C76_775510 [compost metagenome]
MYPISRGHEAILRTKSFDECYDAYAYLDDLINVFGFERSIVLKGSTQWVVMACDKPKEVSNVNPDRS